MTSSPEQKAVFWRDVSGWLGGALISGAAVMIFAYRDNAVQDEQIRVQGQQIQILVNKVDALIKTQAELTTVLRERARNDK